jgi:hypothetical protein
MRSIEQNFVWTTLGADLVTLLTVGFTRQQWNIELGFAFAVCILVVGQLFIRYLAITNWYKTESSIASWTLSILIFPASLALILSSSFNSVWFLILGVLLLLASAKTHQTRKTVLAEPSSNMETAIRLQESMLWESAFGVFMIIFALLARFGSRLSHLPFESTVFYGTLFALFYALVSTSKVILATLRNKPTIRRYLEEP